MANFPNRLRPAVLLLALAAGLLIAPETGIALGSAPLAPATASVGGEIIVSNLENQKSNPAVAYNWKHDEYLVVWENDWPGGEQDIYAQRVSGSGELLSWFAVASGGNRRTSPAIGYDEVNDQYLVVWVYDVNGDASDMDIYGRFIPWEGPSPALTEQPICNWGSSQWLPQVSFGRVREEFLVVWVNTTTTGVPTDLSGRLVKTDIASSPPPFTISSGPEDRAFPSVSYNLARNEYLVTWQQVTGDTDIYAVRLRADGAALGGGEFGIAGWPDDEEKPSVAACRESDKYLVAWHSQVGPGDTDIYARFVNGDGSLDGGPLLIDSTSSVEAEASAACDQGGNNFIVAYHQAYTNLHFGITARQVYSDHSMKPAFAVIPAGHDSHRADPVIVGGMTNFLVAWVHTWDSLSRIDLHASLIYPGRVFLPLVQR